MENFPNLEKETDIQVQEAQRVPNRINPKRTTPKHIVIKKEKIDKFNFIKSKSVHALKNSIKKVKRQPTEWEKISANHLSNKALVYRKQVNTKKTNSPVYKVTKYLNRHFSKENIQTTNKT